MHDDVELRAAHKGSSMTCLENFYIQIYQHQGIVINKENAGKYNPLCEVMHDIQLQYTGM